MLCRLSKFYFSKIFKNASEALGNIPNGSKILVGGFGVCGIPMNLINALKQSNTKDHTIISNDCGVGQTNEPEKDWGLATVLRNKQIKRMVLSYAGQNHQLQTEYIKGTIEVELIPQGTLAEKIRAGGAGIPAFYTATGHHTWIQSGELPIKYKSGGQGVEIYSKPKEFKNFNGTQYILEQSITGDYAFIYAQKADKKGNLYFHRTARNFNQDMATAAKCVIAEVQQIVEDGEIDPDHVHVPGVYVDRIFKVDPASKYSQKRIAKLVYAGSTNQLKKADVRTKIAARAARQITNGMTVNLGVGIPTLVPNYVAQGLQISIHSENGLLGMGPYPVRGKQHPDLINAGKEAVTCAPGASTFSSSQSFAIIRGGHLDVTILGSLQVSHTGDIANWFIPNKKVTGMGGAMDLVACHSRVIVTMQHTAKGAIKLLESCTLPLTAKGVVSMVITDKAVFENRNGKLILTQIAQGNTLEQIQAITGFKIEAVPNIIYF